MSAVVNSRNRDLSWSLIGRAATGDRGAQSEFAHRYLPVVRSFLEARWRATRFAAELDDATQEVFVECLRHDGVLSRANPEQGDLRGLLFGVTRKVAARFEERLIKRARDRAAGSVVDQIRARDASLSKLFDQEWARTLLGFAGDRMRARAERGTPEARRRIELLRLRFTKGMPIREIAAHWQVDPDVLHRAYGKARGEFRVCLRQVVAEHTVRSEVDLDREVERVFALLG